MVSQKNFKGFLGHTVKYYPKLILNSKTICVSKSFKKEISLLSHIAKKLKAR